MATAEQRDALNIVKQMRSMFHEQQALTALVWLLGCHLKPDFGFYPHLCCKGPSCSGKTTLVEVLGELTGGWFMDGAIMRNTEAYVIDEVNRYFDDKSWLEIINKESSLVATFGQDMPPTPIAFTIVLQSSSKNHLYKPTKPFPMEAWKAFTASETDPTKPFYNIRRRMIEDGYRVHAAKNRAAILTTWELLKRFIGARELKTGLMETI